MKHLKKIILWWHSHHTSGESTFWFCKRKNKVNYVKQNVAYYVTLVACRLRTIITLVSLIVELIIQLKICLWGIVGLITLYLLSFWFYIKENEVYLNYLFLIWNKKSFLIWHLGSVWNKKTYTLVSLINYIELFFPSINGQVTGWTTY